MLILGRRVNESIQIGRDVAITILDLQAGMVRLGIEAPRSTRIWRKEVWDGVVDANHKAARAARLFAEGTLEMPHLPVSVFSGLSRLHAVRFSFQDRAGGRRGRSPRLSAPDPIDAEPIDFERSERGDAGVGT